jgi:hypothetical protein
MSQAARHRLRRSTTAGEAPVNATSSSDHRDGTWSDLETYVGELFLNTADERLYVNTGTNILELALGVGDLKTTSISLSSAQISSGNTTPITAVSAIAGKQIQVVSASAKYTYDTAAYTVNTNLMLKADSATNAQGRFSFAGSSDLLGSFDLLHGIDNIVTGDALMLEVDSGDPSGGGGTIDVSITYRITDL